MYHILQKASMGDSVLKIVEYAYAKLNLGLKILGRRSDGFHNILSVFQTVDLCDRLVFEPAGQGQIILSCDDADLPTGPENLVYKAVLAFRSYTGMDRGVEVVIEKRIPMAAGLGGGSSDAAAVLRVLNRVWEAGLSRGELREIGATLGSDVPFFVRQKGTAVVSGRGEIMRYVPWSADVAYVLVCPGFQVHTGWAFANYKKTLTGHGEYDSFINSVKDLPVSGFWGRIENDFLPLIVQSHPETRDILSRLTDAGAVVASMSGSGSTLYGVFESRDVAEAVWAGFKADQFRAFLCCPVV
ncbi:MAG: 4-(cytidine 5'-diphospho)-2-C-methyl-D-erythritol kinase [Gemmatimonadetes bacterium]|nr:4-(cytidine 5'-diphospho)-2-C-methyl-D-erythritol kinase [Gemmatimonadota bacterium]